MQGTRIHGICAPEEIWFSRRLGGTNGGRAGVLDVFVNWWVPLFADASHVENWHSFVGIHDFACYDMIVQWNFGSALPFRIVFWSPHWLNLHELWDGEPYSQLRCQQPRLRWGCQAILEAKTSRKLALCNGAARVTYKAFRLKRSIYWKMCWKNHTFCRNISIQQWFECIQHSCNHFIWNLNLLGVPYSQVDHFATSRKSTGVYNADHVTG